MVSDRRVTYTKKAIREALLLLLEDKDLEKITVKEICGTADINRATFYRYYTDIFDLYASIERELIEALFPDGELFMEDAGALTDKLFHIIYENQGFYREFFRSRMESEFIQKVIEGKFMELTGVMKERDGKCDEKSFRYQFEYMKYGILGILKEWVEHGCKEEPGEMTEMILWIVTKQLER